MKALIAGVGTIAVGTMMALATPASAQVARAPAALAAAASSTNLLTDVQWRGRHYRGHRHGWGGRRHYRGGYWGPGPGAAFGLAAGAMIGSAIAAQNAPVYAAPGYDAAIQSCINRFRSYDVRTQTYLGYDGLRHSCP